MLSGFDLLEYMFFRQHGLAPIIGHTDTTEMILRHEVFTLAYSSCVCSDYITNSALCEAEK